MRLSRGLSFKMAKDDADGDASEGASHPRRRHRHRHHLSAPSNQPPVAGQPVEARSLSGITAIASNPPSYPRNPTQQKLDPLVLYIVRVPGSKDVFLTPLKPPTKSSVSAEAINSSLYYLHAASPDDYALLQKSQLEQDDGGEGLREQDSWSDGQGNRTPPSPALLGRLNQFRRKPVPPARPNASPVTPISPLPPASYQWEQSAFLSSQSRRECIENTSTEQASPNDQLISDNGLYTPPTKVQLADTTRNPSPRRPIPPDGLYLSCSNNSMDGRPNRWSALPGCLDTNIWISKENQGALHASQDGLDSRRPQVRPHSSHGVPPYSDAGSQAKTQRQFPAQGVSNSGPGDIGLRITLVRRDPSYGNQWNVATMTSHKADSGPIEIEVLTPGYTKFATHNDPFSLLGPGVNLPPHIRDAVASSRPPQTDFDARKPRDRFRPRKFHREVRPSRPQQHQHQSSQSQDTSKYSMDALSKIDGVIANASSKLKSGYYSFLSPWNGLCTFSVSLNGQSLKCKHMIPGATSANGPDTPTVTVAELRFNTPFQMATAAINLSGFRDRDKDGSDSPTSKRHTLAALLNPNRPRARSGASLNSNASGYDSDNNNNRTQTGSMDRDEDRLDFSLARENAGGGMKGDEAKLGKLIIEDEGIKMLDLVVAASMAVWWRTYYR